MTQTPRPLFEVGTEISWEGLCLLHDVPENGWPFRACVHTGIIRRIAREEVYIDVHTLTFLDGTSASVNWEEAEVSKVWLAGYVTDDTLRQQIEETFPRNSDPYIVYALRDPRDQVVHYIGVTNRPEKRYREHIRCIDKNVLKTAWVRQLQVEGVQPEMIPLETVR